MMQKSAALIELNGSHEECFYSQLLFLKHGGYYIHLIITQDLARRIERYTLVDQWKIVTLNKGLWSYLSGLVSISKYLTKNKIQKVIMNTAQGKKVRDLMILTGKKNEFVGVLHNGDKLLSSYTQKIISTKIKKYFVLNDFILDNLGSVKNKLSLQAFYPIYFPVKEKKIHKKRGKFLICIPGSVEKKRRDYAGLIDELSHEKPDQNIRFILLGNSNNPDGETIKKAVYLSGLDKHFVFFDHFIPAGVFYDYLLNCRLIIPLITPSVPNFNKYSKYKITGAYNLAYGFRKPMLVHSSLNHIQDFIHTSFFYKTGNLVKEVNRLAKNNKQLECMSQAIPEIPKFQFLEQARRYLNLLEDL